MVEDVQFYWKTKNAGNGLQAAGADPARRLAELIGLLATDVLTQTSVRGEVGQAETCVAPAQPQRAALYPRGLRKTYQIKNMYAACHEAERSEVRAGLSPAARTLYSNLTRAMRAPTLNPDACAPPGLTGPA